MRRLVLYMITSLDGFMARPDGALDWVPVGRRVHAVRQRLLPDGGRHRVRARDLRNVRAFWDGLDPTDPSVTEDAVEFGAIFKDMTRIVVSRTPDKVEGDAILIKDHGEAPWGDDPPFHGPVFVLTHEARAPLVKEGGTTFTFVTDGIERALERARAAAGDKEVSMAGGANVIQQYLKAGLLDELQIHLVPVLIGDGVRLFERLGTEPIELDITRVIESAGVTHIRLRPVKRDARA